MSSQSSLTTRRQFLERSAWGFGSAFLLPSLLTSCTDHLIDPPPIIPSPTNPPLLGDEADIDWNEDAKTLVASALTLIPGVGGLLSGFTKVFWPDSKNSVWNKVESQVNQLVYQAFAKDKFDAATGKLNDLQGNINDYLKKVESGTAAEINGIWETIVEIMVNDLSTFQFKGYEVTLLPLYVQYSNLYLTLLRDPLLPVLDAQGNPVQDAGAGGDWLLTGTTWGMSYKDLSVLQETTRKYITDATKWVDDTYASGRDNVKNSVVESRSTVEPFRSTNAYDRTMTMLVLDYKDTWPYYYAPYYPNGAKNSDGTNIPLFTREIYSDPYGNIVDYSFNPPPFILPPPATQFPTQISIWGGIRLDAVQLTYPDGGGPGGVTQTPRMGDKTGGNNTYPGGFIINISPGGYILDVTVSYGLQPNSFKPDTPMVINTLQLEYLISGINGTLVTPDKVAKGSSIATVGYANYALSSIYIHGSAVGFPNTSCDCIVFGFLRKR